MNRRAVEVSLKCDWDREEYDRLILFASRPSLAHLVSTKLVNSRGKESGKYHPSHKTLNTVILDVSK